MADSSGFVPSSVSANPPRATPDFNGYYPTDTDELMVNQAEVIRQDACARTLLKISELDELMLVGLQRLTIDKLPKTLEDVPVWANQVGRLVNVLRNSHSQREDLILDTAAITTAQRRRDNSNRTYGVARCCDISCPSSSSLQYVIQPPTATVTQLQPSSYPPPGTPQFQ